MRRNYAVGIQHIREALIACGYVKLDKQAKALGLHRSTAWTIIRTKHKLGRLSTKTINRILTNPELPPPVRTIIQWPKGPTKIHSCEETKTHPTRLSSLIAPPSITP